MYASASRVSCQRGGKVSCAGDLLLCTIVVYDCGAIAECLCESFIYCKARGSKAIRLHSMCLCSVDRQVYRPVSLRFHPLRTHPKTSCMQAPVLRDHANMHIRCFRMRRR